MGWARPSQPSPVTGPNQWPGWATLGTRDLNHACMAPAIELSTVGKNEIRQSGKTEQETYLVRLQGICAWLLRTTLLPSTFFLHLLLFTLYSFPASLFLFILLRFFCSVFRTNLYSLSVSFVYCCFRLILVRERLTSGLGFNQKT
jgi:hypothetical protein